MVTGHYAKRVLESLYVHIFSRPTIPFKRSLMNYTHYWIIFGGLISTEFCHFYTKPFMSNR